MAVTVRLFTSIIVQLESIMFVKLYGLHSVIKCCKCMVQEDVKVHNEYTVDDWLYIAKEDALLSTYQKRYQEYALKHGTILTFVKFNNFGTRCL